MSKPRTQSNLMNNRSDDFITIDKRKWSDILAYEDVARKSLEWIISELDTNLVGHRFADREADGAVHWSSLCPKLRREFKKKADIPSLILIGLSVSGKGAIIFDFSIQEQRPLVIRVIQGHTGEELVAPELMNHVAIPDQKNSCIIQEALEA